MQNNSNLALEPEEKNIAGIPADEQQMEDMQDATTPNNEEPLPADDDMEEGSQENDEIEKAGGERGNSDVEEPSDDDSETNDQ